MLKFLRTGRRGLWILVPVVVSVVSATVSAAAMPVSRDTYGGTDRRASAAATSVTFGRAVNYPVRGSAASVAVGDFNGDGRRDLAVADATGVAVLLGRGDGTFQPAVNYRVQGGGNGVAIGDLNGDGHPDLVVADSSGVAVLLGRGDGTFQPAINYPVSGGPSAIAIGDLNSDGRADVVTADFGSGNVSVLLGRSSPL